MRHGQKYHFNIYRSRRHIAATIFFVLLPLIFFIAFARISHIAIRDLSGDLAVSALRLIIAYVISVVIAWSAAIFTYRSRAAHILLPLADVLQSVPVFTLLPLAVLSWGAKDELVIGFLCLAIIWPIFFSVVSSLKLIRNDWEEAVVMARLDSPMRLLHFLYPASLPGVVTGSIIGLGEGWEALIATEIIAGSHNGLGRFFSASSQNPTLTFFGVLGLLLFIFVINKIIWLPLLEKSHEKLEE